LKHDPEKLMPVFHATNVKHLRGDHAQTKSHRALATRTQSGLRRKNLHVVQLLICGKFQPEIHNQEEKR
jgi:hypothetical protein